MPKSNGTDWRAMFLEPLVILLFLAFVAVLAIGKIYFTQQKLIYVYDHLPEYEITIKCTDRQFKDHANLVLSSKEYAVVDDEDMLVNNIIPNNCKIIEVYQLGSPLNGYNSF